MPTPIYSTDLEFILTQPQRILDRYAASLNSSAQQQFEERIARWRKFGPTLADYPAIKMYRAGLDRIDVSIPAPQPSYTEKQISLQQAEEALVEAARNDPFLFIEYVNDKPLPRHHKIWIANMIHPDRPFVNIIAPPGSGKTTVVNALLAYYIGLNPLWTNAIISVSDIQAQSRLADIKFMIQYNERFQNVFPHIKIDPNRTNNMSAFSVWDDRMSYPQWVTLLQRKGHPRDPSLFAAGSGNTGIIGRRWSGYCMIDDMVDQQMLTEQLMKEAFDFVAITLLSRLTETGRAVNIGTRWMNKDLIQRLRENSQWFTIEFPAIYFDENSQPHSYWPEAWPLERLEKKKLSMRQDDGSDMLFELMYLNNPQASAAALFTPEQLARDLPDHDVALSQIFITTDWALKVAQRNDFTVFQAVGIDDAGNYYLLEQRRYKMGLDSSPQALADFADVVADRYGKLDDILIEAIGFSESVGMLLQSHRPDLPYMPVPPKGDKGHRAKLVSDLAHSGKLFINQRMEQLDVLKQEWLYFGTAKHDDTLDPMGLLVQYQGKGRVSAKLHIYHSPYLL